MAGSIYESLAPDEIRLLRFRPGSELVATLERINLVHAPPYIALSYTWGRAPVRKGRSLSATYSIILNDQRFAVQENLYDALVYLLHRVQKKGCPLWVDAICINQRDIKERNAQILHMRYIYEHADMVLGWLGVPHSEDEIAMAVSVMERFHVVLRDGLARHNEDMYAVAAEITPSNKNIYPKPGTDCYKGWLGIREIFERTYWNRIWIYQEATGIAPTRFCCGNSWFGMNFVNASVYMAHHFAEYNDIDFPFRDIARGPAFGLSAFREDGVIKYGDTLLELLEWLRSTQSSEPRDKVYAVLGFSSDLSPSSIMPDYAKPLDEVYKDIVRFSLSQSNHGLDFLSLVTHCSEDSEQMVTGYDNTDFPSWLPDFREHVGPNTFCTKIVDGTCAYRACGPHQNHMAVLDNSMLKLQGIHIDQIATLSSIWDSDAFDTARVQSWAPDTPTAIYAPTGQIMDEAFRTTLLADMNVLTKSRGHKVDFELINARADKITADQGVQRNRMNVALKTHSGVRRLGWTTHGRMGLMAPAARVGDSLYVLFGGQMIYILRNKGDNLFEYVGNAYIHGIMDGEVFADEDNVGVEKIEKVTLV